MNDKKPILSAKLAVSGDEYPIIICANTGIYWSHICCKHKADLFHICSKPEFSQLVVEGFIIRVNKSAFPKWCDIPKVKVKEIRFEGFIKIIKFHLSKLVDWLDGYSDGFIKRIEFDYSKFNEIDVYCIPVIVYIYGESNDEEYKRSGYLCSNPELL